MTARYFVVEGNNDEFILQHLLPKPLLQDTKIIVASGYSAALSVIQSLFTLTPLPVSFFFDTDTYSDDKIEEKKQFTNSYLKKLFANEFLLFPMKPEMEILFFYKKDLFEKLIGQSIDNELWQQAKYRPKQILNQLIGDNKSPFFLAENPIIKKNLTDDLVHELQQNPLLQDIIRLHSFEPQAIIA
ncbi:MAG: hypothetical protein EPN17_06095 [Methylobacter sp.]|nr:MAG: hypothetical protein EPN17_06095 [Methylobacter sp.]